MPSTHEKKQQNYKPLIHSAIWLEFIGVQVPSLLQQRCSRRCLNSGWISMPWIKRWPQTNVLKNLNKYIYIYTCWDGSLSVIMDYGNQNPFKRNAKRQWVNTWKRHSFHHRSPIKKLSHVCIDFAWYIAVLFLLHYKKESSRARCLAWWGLNLFNGPC